VNELTKIIVLDDDPTGSQTVHGCLLLTRWDVDTLRIALCDDAPLFFILTNTRGMDALRAGAVTREVCRNLKTALRLLKQEGMEIRPVIVSRSDSTLRGHYPVETDVIAEELGPFDAHFLVPAFFEGGRITRGSVHYLVVDGKPLPTHETEFARDSVFGYSTSYLPAYVEEKTRGRITAAQVDRFLLSEVRGEVLPRLRALSGNRCCVVDAERQGDLDHFAEEVKRAAEQGKRFLFRSAASLITALASLPPQPAAPTEMAAYVRGGRAGAVLIGSHVRKSTMQLERLLNEPDVVPIEVDVTRIGSAQVPQLRYIEQEAERAHRAGRTPVIYTSRTERHFPDVQARLAFGEEVSAFLMEVVRNLPPSLGFLISKGGITSNDVLSSGLALRSSRLLGQILAGVSVLRCPEDHPRFPNMLVVIFPGNVGDDDALATVLRRLRPLQ